MRQRMLSLLMVCALCLSLLPLSVSAKAGDNTFEVIEQAEAEDAFDVTEQKTGVPADATDNTVDKDSDELGVAELAGVTLTWPVPGHTSLSQGYHDGNAIDIADGSITGATIVAAYSGTVRRIYTCPNQHYGNMHLNVCDGFGTGVVIDGDDGRTYQYAHMQANSIPSNVYAGVYVTAGQKIGQVGATGNASGAHLHFGISNSNNIWGAGPDPSQETYSQSGSQPGSQSGSGSNTVSASWSLNTNRHWVGETNAVVSAILRVNGTSINNVTEVGVALYDASHKKVASKDEKPVPSGDYIEMWYDVNSELGYTLTPGAYYEVMFGCSIQTNSATSGIISSSPTYPLSGGGHPATNSGNLQYTVNGDNITITGCDEGVTSLTIPGQIDGKPVTAISGSAFKNRPSLNEVTIPASVTSIGQYAFYNSAKKIIFADGIKTIPDNACYHASNLTEVVIPSGITSVGRGAFEDCAKLTGDISVPNGVITIGGNAFNGCNSLNQVTVPASVTTIGQYAFYNSARKIIFADGIKTIPDNACYHASNLTEVVIPSGITSVGRGAFEDCGKLADVYYAGSQSQWNAITIQRNNDSLTSASIHYNSLPETSVAVTGVSLNKSTLSLSIGSSEKLTATVIPANATNKSVQWTSSNTSIATVDSNGTVTAKAAGATTINVKTLDGNRTASCAVSVSSTPSSTVTQITVENQIVLPNSEFTVPVTIKNNPGISGATLAVSYDKSAFTLSAITKGTVFETGNFSAYPETGVTLWYHTENVTANGTLFTLHFVVSPTVTNGDYNIAIGLRDGVPANLSNANSEIVNAEFISGVMTVVSGTRGDVTGDGVVAINDVVKLARAVAGNITLSAQEKEVADVTGDGVVAINDVVKLARYVAGNIASLQSAEAMLCSESASAVIKTASVRAEPGETVQVPVSITSNPGIAGVQLDILFDDNLTLKNIIRGDILSVGTFNPDVSNGRIQWYYDQANVTNTGVLFTLEFDVSGSAEDGKTYAVTVNVKDGVTANLSDYDFNIVNAEFKSGKVQIGEAADTVINQVNRNGTTVTAEIICTNINATAFCGTYKNDGQFVTLGSREISGASTYNFQFDGYQFDYAKVFVLDSSQRPLCESKRS